MRKTVFEAKKYNLGRRVRTGFLAGMLLGIIAGLIEGEVIYISLRGFNDSAWMLFITPLLYCLVGGIYGAFMGALYHLFSPPPNTGSVWGDFSCITSIIILSLFCGGVLVWANKILVFPRLHPVSLAADAVIITAFVFLWRYTRPLLSPLKKIMRRYLLLFLVLGLIALGIFNLINYKNFTPAFSPPPERMKQLRLDSVIILMIDTLRADHLGCYGYPRPVSPAIDFIASEGLLYEHHYSSSSWTVPSHFSLMTGVTSGAVREEFSIADDSVTIAERLQLLGYRTACLSANPLLSRGINFHPGFDLFDSDINLINRLNNLQLFNLLSHIKLRRPIHTSAIKLFNTAELVTDYAIDWLKEYASEPYFLFINYMDVHDPYLPPENYRRLFSGNYKGKFTGDICGDLSEAEFIKYVQPGMTKEDWDYVISQYDGAIRYIDDQVSRLVRYLKDKGRFEDTIFIILSDHGELFGEYNLATHHLTLSDEETHCPLIIHYPKVIRNAARVKTIARIIDIYPTLQELIGFKLTDKIFIEGMPLVDREGKPTSGAPFAALVLYENQFKASVLGPAFKRNLFCYRTAEWKYLYPQRSSSVNWAPFDAAIARRDPSIFRPEQAQELVYRLKEDGIPEAAPETNAELLITFRYLFNKWRDYLKMKKPPLGSDRESRRLLQDLVDGKYIKPY